MLIRFSNAYRLSGSILLALALLLGGGRAVGATAPAWLRIKTDDFIAYTDGREKDLVDFAVKYTAFQQAFRSLFVAPGKQLPPTILVLFKRYSALEEYQPAQPKRNDDVKTTNYSVEAEGTAYMALSLSDGQDNAFKLTAEFETIWALRRVGYYVPLWAAQGAGMNLSTVSLRRGKCLFGEVPDGYENFSLWTKGLPWPRFFEVNEASPEYLGKKDSGVFHGQACELMNWILFKDAGTRDRFSDLARKLRTVSPQQAVEEIMGVPAAQFIKQINTHLTHHSRPQELPFDEARVRAGFVVEPASQAEILIRTAAFLASARKEDRCKQQLAQAFLLDPQSRILKEARAQQAIRENNLDEAVRLYREAIADGSTNYLAYLRSASMRLDDVSGRRDEPGTGGLGAGKAADEIRRALELNPGSVEGYNLLGRAFYLLPKVSDALLDELGAGLTPGEDSWQVRYYYALLNERLGKPDHCVAEMKKILTLTDISDNTRRHVERQLSYATYRITATKVKELVESSQPDAAHKIIADAEAEERNQDVRSLYQRLDTRVRQREAQR